MRLSEKLVVVTGATGIAAAGARAFAAAGARVFVISLNQEDCDELTSTISTDGGSVASTAADLTDEHQAVEAFSAALDHLGAIDGLFAVAGGSGRRYGDGPLDELSLEGWTRTLEINGLPAFLASRETIRGMGESGGSIVLVSSVLAASPVPDLFATHAYAASKGAINALTTSLAAHYAQQGIRVNAIAPGLVDTPMAARAAGDPETVAFAARKQPLAGGLLDPEDVSAAAVFFLSDESARITGQVLAVDGGWSVTST